MVRHQGNQLVNIIIYFVQLYALFYAIPIFSLSFFVWGLIELTSELRSKCLGGHFYIFGDWLESVNALILRIGRYCYSTSITINIFDWWGPLEPKTTPYPLQEFTCN